MPGRLENLRTRVRFYVSRFRAMRRVLRNAARIMGKDVVIVVLNWNRRDDTLDCLQSLFRADLDGARVMVVDNGSQDGSADAIRSRFPRVEVVALPENQGFAGGNNAGLRTAIAADAQAVLVLNNDTVVAPDFMLVLLDTLNMYPQAAAVAGAVFRADSPEVLDAAYLEIYFGHGLVHRRGVNKLPGEGFDIVRPIDVGIGCCLLMRTTALRKVGLFDEAYFAYHEEVDWCYRAHQEGLEIYYQPNARVWHKGSRSTAQKTRPARQVRTSSTLPQLPNAIPLSWNPVRTYLGARNAVRFIRKHGTRRRKVYYLLSSLYAVPLELLAVVMGREEDLMLGLWTYQRAFRLYCLDGAPDDGPGARIQRLLRVPGHLLWSLPRDIRAAHRDGATAQIVEHVRGLWDGYRDRPLPLERLGLR